MCCCEPGTDGRRLCIPSHTHPPTHPPTITTSPRPTPTTPSRSYVRTYVQTNRRTRRCMQCNAALSINIKINVKRTRSFFHAAAVCILLTRANFDGQALSLSYIPAASPQVASSTAASFITAADFFVSHFFFFFRPTAKKKKKKNPLVILEVYTDASLSPRTKNRTAYFLLYCTVDSFARYALHKPYDISHPTDGAQHVKRTQLLCIYICVCVCLVRLSRSSTPVKHIGGVPSRHLNTHHRCCSSEYIYINYIYMYIYS